MIPVLLHRGTRLVKGKRFDSSRVVGHVLQAVRTHQARGVDELIVLDAAATPEGRGPDFKLIEQITRDCFSPITIGGGVRSVQDVRDLLNAGADKVCIKSRTELVYLAASVVGSQAVVACVDYMASRCALWQAQDLESRGAGEILLQSIDRDGMMTGYDLDLIRIVSTAVSIPVIAAGGCSGYEDMRLAIDAGASAVAAGALFQFTDATPRGAAKYLQEHGIEARV